jgi:hypothetical protein
MAAVLTQPARYLDSERLRRRRDRHVRLAADRALTEVAFELRARERQAGERTWSPDRLRVAPSSPQGRERDSRLGSGASRRR